MNHPVLQWEVSLIVIYKQLMNEAELCWLFSNSGGRIQSSELNEVKVGNFIWNATLVEEIFLFVWNMLIREPVHLLF